MPAYCRIQTQEVTELGCTLRGALLYKIRSFCKSLLCSMFNEQTCTRFTRLLLFVTMPKIAFMPIYIDFEHWCHYISCSPDQTRPDQTRPDYHSKDLKVCLLTSDFCIVPPGLFLLRSNWDNVKKGKHWNTNRKASQIEQLSKSHRLSECGEDWEQMQMR